MVQDKKNTHAFKAYLWLYIGNINVLLVSWLGFSMDGN
jgi:hypothetical protein